MKTFSRKQMLIVGIPIALIVVLLPVAIFVAVQMDESNETNKVGPANEAAAVEDIQGVDTVVQADDISFRPEQVTVAQGEAVGFQNLDRTHHNVTIDGKSIGDMEGGQNLVWTAEESGEFDFYCAFHQNQMQGTITVTAQ